MASSMRHRRAFGAQLASALLAKCSGDDDHRPRAGPRERSWRWDRQTLCRAAGGGLGRRFRAGRRHKPHRAKLRPPRADLRRALARIRARHGALCISGTDSSAPACIARAASARVRSESLESTCYQARVEDSRSGRPPARGGAALDAFISGRPPGPRAGSRSARVSARELRLMTIAACIPDCRASLSASSAFAIASSASPRHRAARCLQHTARLIAARPGIAVGSEPIQPLDCRPRPPWRSHLAARKTSSLSGCTLPPRSESGAALDRMKRIKASSAWRRKFHPLSRSRRVGYACHASRYQHAGDTRFLQCAFGKSQYGRSRHFDVEHRARKPTVAMGWLG